MIVGLSKKAHLVAKPVAPRREEPRETLVPARRQRRPGPFAAFVTMMERHADLVLRGLGD